MQLEFATGPPPAPPCNRNRRSVANSQKTICQDSQKRMLLTPLRESPLVVSPVETPGTPLKENRVRPPSMQDPTRSHVASVPERNRMNPAENARLIARRKYPTRPKRNFRICRCRTNPKRRPDVEQKLRHSRNPPIWQLAQQKSVAEQNADRRAPMPAQDFMGEKCNPSETWQTAARQKIPADWESFQWPGAPSFDRLCRELHADRFQVIQHTVTELLP